MRSAASVLLVMFAGACAGPAQSGDAAPDAGDPGPPDAGHRVFLRTPLVRQATDYTCGAAALESVLYYYGDEVNESDLARELGTNETDGTRTSRIVSYAKAHGYQAEAKTDLAVADLEAYVDSGRPALVLLQAWSDGPVDWDEDWEDGHIAVFTGYDAARLYFMDPLVTGAYAYLERGEFPARWHDVDGSREVEHMAVVVWKDHPAFDPDAVVRMR